MFKLLDSYRGPAFRYKVDCFDFLKSLNKPFVKYNSFQKRDTEGIVFSLFENILQSESFWIKISSIVHYFALVIV